MAPDPEERQDPGDEELLEAARRGDAEAFDTLYLRYRQWVVRLAGRMTGSQHDALDVLQDTFSYVLRKLPDLRLRGRFTTFLYPVVRNLSWMRRRRAGREGVSQQLEEDLPALAVPDQEPWREDLAHVLGKLPQGQREVILLRFVDELSLGEIARALGVPPGTVKSRLHHGLRALREDPRTRAYFLADR